MKPTLLATVLFPLLALGCTHPSEDNIRLRKINQELSTKIDTLTRQNEARERTIVGLQKRIPTIPALPPEQLNKLWTAAGLEFGNLSGGGNLDSDKPGAEGLLIYVCPTDQEGGKIQAAGSFLVEAFDLAEPDGRKLGKWEWDTTAAKACWRNFLLDFGYRLPCPWQNVPRHSDITVRVTFTDELTHISFNAQSVVHLDKLPTATTAPTTAPSR